jgi:hypothetical protein
MRLSPEAYGEAWEEGQRSTLDRILGIETAAR